MNQTLLTEIEQKVLRLSADEQLLLISRVAENLRRKVDAGNDNEFQLAQMANDSEIQRELKEIEADFKQNELDATG